MSTLTPDAKSLLSSTIRELRTRLLRDLHEAVDGRYRFSTPIDKAGLDEATKRKRKRFEDWIDERARATKPKDKAQLEEAKARFRLTAETEAAATFLNRLVLIRHLEALGLSKPAMMLSSVDLPQPEGPRRQRNSPGRTARLISERASVSWRRVSNRRDTPRTSRARAEAEVSNRGVARRSLRAGASAGAVRAEFTVMVRTPSLRTD